MIPVKITAKFYEIDIRMIFIKIGRFAKSDSLWEIYIFQDLYKDLYTFFIDNSYLCIILYSVFIENYCQWGDYSFRIHSL